MYIYVAISRVQCRKCSKAFLGNSWEATFSQFRSALAAAEMSSEIGYRSSGSDKVRLNLEETELTLALPGESRVKSEILVKSGVKRLFLETIDLNLGRSSSEEDGAFKNDASRKTKSPPARTQAVGWPPVRASRKNAMKRIKLVKVAVDGAPYLRKVDLEMYKSYQQLLSALEDMFSCLAIRNYLNERKTIDPAIANGVEYVPSYEDRDGDWMLIGDVPWQMFVESCKRLRLMKSSEAVGLESLNCTNSN